MHHSPEKQRASHINETVLFDARIMTIHVRYFASLREQFGCAEEQLSVDGIETVADVWSRVTEGQSVSAGSVLYAVNMAYAEADTSVDDGDEVAFFPPVTGGAN
jgi:sulfur-carrier protein